MMNKTILYILAFLVTGVMAAACANDDPMPGNDQEPSHVEIKTQSIPAGTDCNLYLFKKGSSDTEYKMDRTIAIAAPAGTATVTFPQGELSTHNYRFLFVSQPAAISNGVTITNASDAALAAGDLWSSVRITSQAKEMSGAVYYKVADFTGATLAATTTPIAIELNLLVGRQLIDIFKVGDAGMTAPEGTTAAVWSVLDRVTEIRLTYTGLTKVIGFNADGTISEKSGWGSSLVKTTTLTAEETVGNDLLKVLLPQTGVKVGAYTGSARIEGVWGLSATNQVRIEAKFSYYHTTPILCTDSSPGTHAHDKSCYQYKGADSGSNSAIFLNLPKAAATPISIKPNVYTINKVGIGFDRVIDVGVSGGFGFATDWTNGDV